MCVYIYIYTYHMQLNSIEYSSQIHENPQTPKKTRWIPPSFISTPRFFAALRVSMARHHPPSEPRAQHLAASLQSTRSSVSSALRSREVTARTRGHLRKFMVIFWWFFGDFMVIEWGDLYGIFWWFFGDFMVIQWGDLYGIFWWLFRWSLCDVLVILWDFLVIQWGIFMGFSGGSTGFGLGFTLW